MPHYLGLYFEKRMYSLAVHALSECVNLKKIARIINHFPKQDEIKYGLVYFVIIQEVCWVLLLLQSLQFVLELHLKVLHLTEDYGLSRTTATLTLCSDLLAVNDLMKQSENTPQVQTGPTNEIF